MFCKHYAQVLQLVHKVLYLEIKHNCELVIIGLTCSNARFLLS